MADDRPDQKSDQNDRYSKSNRETNGPRKIERDAPCTAALGHHHTVISGAEIEKTRSPIAWILPLGLVDRGLIFRLVVHTGFTVAESEARPKPGLSRRVWQ
jgi:hypothetical protein